MHNTRVPLRRADLCQHFTIVFFFIRRRILSSIPERKALESDLIECFLLLLSLSTLFFLSISLGTMPDRLSIDFCAACLFQMGFLRCAWMCNVPANRTVPITWCASFWMNCATFFSLHPLFSLRHFYSIFFFQCYFATFNEICSCFLCLSFFLFFSRSHSRFPLEGFKLYWVQYISHA